MQRGGWAVAAAVARHHLAESASLMAAWHEDVQDSGIGALERLRALLSEWWRRVFRRDHSR